MCLPSASASGEFCFYVGKIMVICGSGSVTSKSLSGSNAHSDRTGHVPPATPEKRVCRHGRKRSPASRRHSDARAHMFPEKARTTHKGRVRQALWEQLKKDLSKRSRAIENRRKKNNKRNHATYMRLQGLNAYQNKRMVEYTNKVRELEPFKKIQRMSQNRNVISAQTRLIQEQLKLLELEQRKAIIETDLDNSIHDHKSNVKHAKFNGWRCLNCARPRYEPRPKPECEPRKLFPDPRPYGPIHLSPGDPGYEHHSAVYIRPR